MAGGKKNKPDKLCRTCERLPLVLDHNVRHKVSGELELGTVEMIQTKRRCPLCRLLWAAHRDGKMFHANMPMTIKWNPSRGFHSDYSQERLVFLCPISYSSPAASVHWTGRGMNSTVDVALIKKWLSLCEDLHGDDGPCCPTTTDIMANPTEPSQPAWFKVFDVVDKRIVTAPPKCRYVALSYIWGQGKSWRASERLSAWMSNGFLTNPFYEEDFKAATMERERVYPLTIADAIELVSRMGERYLWVDSVCMDQNDAAAMRWGLQHMDLIFEGSVLTIVAAFGSDNNAGLPGLRPHTRTITQLSEEVRRGVKMATASTLYTLLNETKYMTRGWTYV